MFNIGPLELMVILVVALLVVGPKRLPEVGRSIGRGLREFRRAQQEVQRTISIGLEEPSSTSPSSPEESSEPATSDTPSPSPGEDAPKGAKTSGSSTSGAAEIAATLGQGIAELRRVREEIRRGLQLDLGDEHSAHPSAGPSTRTPSDPDGEPADDPPPASSGEAG
jgi:sec-independent protein translocase protein TatA